MKLLQIKGGIGIRRVAAAFTLIELVICTAIISLMSVALFSGITQGLAVVSIARENLRATQIMVEKIELLRLYSWTELNTPGFIPSAFAERLMPSSATNSSTTAASVDRLETPSGAGTIFVGTISISTPSLNASYSNNMKLATLTVTWTNGNVNRSRTMQTLVAEKGIHDYIY